jgi:hypothetical protein
MEPATIIEQSASAAEWGPWIEWPGGECPIPHLKAGEYEMRSIEGDKGCSGGWAEYVSSRNPACERAFAGCWAHKDGCWPVVAYRVRKAKSVAPDPNAAMLARDMQGVESGSTAWGGCKRVHIPAGTYTPEEIGRRAGQSESGGLLSCAAVTHKLGGWGVQS